MRGERVTKVAQGLEKMGKPNEAIAPANEPPETKSPVPETKPSSPETKSPDDATKQPDPATNAQVDATKAPEAAPAADGKKDKPNPWKMYEQAKAENGSLKQKIHELETKGVNPKEKDEFLERIAKYEEKIKGYEDDLRYTNYSKSAEFKEKYQNRYDDRWKLAMGELNELTVPNPDGSERAFKADDLLELMHLPLRQAHAKAQELYGDLAGTVLNHRTELRRIHDEMNSALEEAKTKGSEREKKISEQRAIEQKQVDTLIAQSFEAAHKASLKDPSNGRFFNQVDGDDEFNASLQRGKELSAAFLQSPAAPGLSAEQRKEISEKHAAIFNRSAAFGPMKLLLTRLEKKVSTLEKELSGFKQSSPAAATNGAPAPAPVAPTGRKMDSFRAGIAALSKS